MEPFQRRLEPFLAAFRQVSFIRQVDVAKARAQETGDLAVTISDRHGRHFRFRGEFKTSYLDRPSVHTVAANARQYQRDAGCPTLVFARYVPLPTAEQFLEAGVNFVDLAGNLHLVLGTQYERTIMGHVEPRKAQERQRITAAQLQVLFLFATQSESVAWPVREIGTQAGVSKSKAAGVRSELVASGLIAKAHPNRFRATKATEELLVSGYSQILRPKLVLGRFRAPERDLADFLKRLPEAFEGSSWRYALSGGPAAEALQHFYCGSELPLFVSDDGAELRHRLRLLPDRNGPITLLRAFGELVFWRQVSSWMVAPPWLVYSELMNADDPRAHEAAIELRREFLNQ
jgi:hypothetical protein